MKPVILPLFLPAAAQTPATAPQPAADTQVSDLAGHWPGSVTETAEGRTLHYSMAVDIDADRGGNPVATVEYSLHCRGLWIPGEGVHEMWVFNETITAGREECEPYNLVELTRHGAELHVRMTPVGYEEAAEAVLRRE